MSRRQRILDIVEGLVDDLLFDGSEADGFLPRGSVDDAIEAGEITKAEIAEHFRDRPEKWLRVKS